MATPELAEGEVYDFEGVHIWGEIDEKGEQRTYMSQDGNVRELVVDIDGTGGHLDYLEFEAAIPKDEKDVALQAVRYFAIKKAPQVIGEEIITVEDPHGNLL